MIKRFEGMLKRLLPHDNTEPLVMRRAICDEICDEIVALGEGRRIFPYDRVLVQVYAPDDKQQVIYEASFIEGQQLRSSIRERLEQEGCSQPDDVRVDVEIVRERPEEWGTADYNLIYSRGRAQEKDEDVLLPLARLKIVNGRSKNKSYRIKKKKYYIGRLDEVIDKHGFPVRRNDVVFLDTEDDLNSTVSRAHAYIEYDDRTRGYILHDTNSRRGTRVERDGQLVEVSGPLGLRLQNGDVLFFGRASAQFFLQD